MKTWRRSRPSIRAAALPRFRTWWREIPTAGLIVVGLNPGDDLVQLAKRHGFPVHANVPSLEPYYRACDVVIAPVMFDGAIELYWKSAGAEFTQGADLSR